MSTRLKIGIGVIAALAWVVVGLIVARGPQPEIIVPAEVITSIGFFNVTNTLIAAWTAMVILIVASVLATRVMKLIPSRAQNFFEFLVEFLLGQMEDIAGSKNARRFFPVIATFFIFILLSNWMGLLPFFNAIGKTEDVGHHLFHVIAEHYEDHEDFVADLSYDGWLEAFDEELTFSGWIMDDVGIGLVRPNADAVHFELGATPENPITPSHALDQYLVFLAESFTDFKASDYGAESDGHGPLVDVPPEMLAAAIAALEAEPSAPKLITADPHKEEGEGDGHDDAAGHHDEGDAHGAHGVTSAVGTNDHGHPLVVTAIDFPDKKLALIIPLFRSVYSDVNNTLALALISFVMVEFWGLRTLGFGYLKKFFNFSGLIPAFVGILELLSEFIRIISFAFRLFGNIFAGEVLILMLTFLLPFLIVDIIYGLELFVGFIQAAVFALLTLVFAVMAVEHHDEEHEDHESEADHDDMESQGSPGQ